MRLDERLWIFELDEGSFDETMRLLMSFAQSEARGSQQELESSGMKILCAHLER
jgi:hypothetical protein